MIDPVSFTEHHWGISLKRTGRYEWVGPCPWCGQGRDRWHLFTDDPARVWCRVCDKTVILETLEDKSRLTAEERRLRRIEAEQRKAQREREQLARRMTALERIHNTTDHIKYNRQMRDGHREYWASEGIYDPDKWTLGFCLQCPTDRDRRPSYTIPVYRRGVLENIRHRLVGATTDKYRPHIAGLGIQLFNSDVLDDKPARACILEGSKKGIILSDAGFPSVAMMGKRSFKKSWIPWFDGIRDIVIALDPDAQDSAVKLAKLFPRRARVATLPAKIDDMIVRYGAGADDIESFLRLARPV